MACEKSNALRSIFLDTALYRENPALFYHIPYCGGANLEKAEKALPYKEHRSTLSTWEMDLTS